MADATIDELLAAIETVQRTKATLLGHDTAIADLLDRVARVEAKLAALETHPMPRQPGEP